MERKLNIGTKYMQDGKEFEVIDRAGDVVIVFAPDYGYEVYKVRKQKERVSSMGVTYREGEFAPSNNSFGTKNEDGFYPLKYAKLAMHSFEKIKSDMLVSPEVK